MARLSAAFACCVMFLLSTAPVFAQPGRLGGGGALNLSLTRIVMSLILCLMLAALAAFALKRSGGRFDLKRMGGLIAKLPVQRRVEVVETRRASQYADICLIRCDGREYLVLSSQQQHLVLRETECPAPTFAPASEGAA